MSIPDHERESLIELMKNVPNRVETLLLKVEEAQEEIHNVMQELLEETRQVTQITKGIHGLVEMFEEGPDDGE